MKVDFNSLDQLILKSRVSVHLHILFYFFLLFTDFVSFFFLFFFIYLKFLTSSPIPPFSFTLTIACHLEKTIFGGSLPLFSSGTATMSLWTITTLQCIALTLSRTFQSSKVGPPTVPSLTTTPSSLTKRKNASARVTRRWDEPLTRN